MVRAEDVHKTKAGPDQLLYDVVELPGDEVLSSAIRMSLNEVLPALQEVLECQEHLGSFRVRKRPTLYGRVHLAEHVEIYDEADPFRIPVDQVRHQLCR